MTTTRTKTPPVSIEELYDQWSGRLAKTVRSFGFPEDEVSDVIQELLTRFIEGKTFCNKCGDLIEDEFCTHCGVTATRTRKNYLSIYDPTKAAFSTYMYTFVLTRLRGWRARRDFRLRKELPLFDLQTTDGDTMPMSFIDTSSKSFDDVESSCNIQCVLKQLRDSGDSKLAGLLEDMIEQLESDGKVDRVKLAHKQHIGLVELRKQFDRMRELQLIRDWRYCE